MNGAERKLLVLAGPTASGKTSLALKLAAKLPLRLISADSMQVYRGMDIGTAKPGPGDREKFALIDLIEPGDSYSAGRFARDASQACEEAWNSALIPCLVGGTGLYLRALLQGMAELPATTQSLRDEVAAMPLQAQVAELSQLDPETAAKIDLKNPRRVSRALEVRISTGKGLSQWQQESQGESLNYGQLLGFCLSQSPEDLGRRIHQRNKEALQRGWQAETRALVARYGSAKIRATGAIGYDELMQVDEGILGLDEAQTAIETRTLQYARRQRTWFRKEPQLEWSGDLASIEASVIQFIKG